MKKLISLFAVAAIAMFAAYLPSGPARAQLVCGPGTTPSPAGPGSPVPCIPISDYSGGNSSGSGGHWEKRWGAFASGDAGLVGIGAGEASKRKAEKAAIAHCQSRGDANCMVDFSYYNHCAVVVTGQKPDGKWVNRFASAGTREEASQLGLDSCRAGGAPACEIKFSECSLAEFVE